MIDPRLAARALAPGRVRDTALRLLLAAEADPARASGILRAGLREARYLHSAERRLVGDGVYDAIRWRGVLGRLGVTEPGDRWDRWVRWKAEGDAEIDATIASLAGGAAEDLADLASVPAPVAEQLRQRFGEEAAAFVLASNGRAPIVLRANRRRGTREEVRERLAARGIATEPSPHAPDALRVVGPANVEGTPELRDGWIELQDEASQAAAAWASEGITGEVLDFCAGAGGKALALAAAGLRVLATDVRPDPLEELRRRAARAGVRVETGLAPTGELPRELRDRFDLVLVDAPCTGTGVWRRHPELRVRSGHFADHAALQLAILLRAAGAVRPGGRLVYATCSVLPAEDEDVVAAFLARAPEFSRAAGDRLWAPHRDGTDGFYAARLTRGTRGGSGLQPESGAH